MPINNKFSLHNEIASTVFRFDYVTTQWVLMQYSVTDIDFKRKVICVMKNTYIIIRTIMTNNIYDD